MNLGKELGKLGVDGYDKVKVAIVEDFKNELLEKISSPVISVLIEGDKVLQSKIRTSKTIDQGWKQPQCRIILDYIHNLDKDAYESIWKDYLSKNSNSYQYKNNGLYIVFGFRVGSREGVAHYFVGRKYANELSDHGTYYTPNLLSIESDGLYLNKQKVEVV